jgi:hypothetical protein
MVPWYQGTWSTLGHFRYRQFIRSKRREIIFKRRDRLGQRYIDLASLVWTIHVSGLLVDAPSSLIDEHAEGDALRRFRAPAGMGFWWP